MSVAAPAYATKARHTAATLHPDRDLAPPAANDPGLIARLAAV